MENIGDDDVLGKTTIVGTVASNRDLLMFYCSLSRAEIACLSSDMGLDLRALSPESRKQAEKLISQTNSRLVGGSDIALIMRLTRSENTRIFRVSGDDRPDGVTWK